MSILFSLRLTKGDKLVKAEQKLLGINLYCTPFLDSVCFWLHWHLINFMPLSVTWLNLSTNVSSSSQKSITLNKQKNSKEFVEEYNARVDLLWSHKAPPDFYLHHNSHHFHWHSENRFVILFFSCARNEIAFHAWILKANIDFCLYKSIREGTDHEDFSAILNF